MSSLARERYLQHNTLSGLLIAMKHQRLTIETIQESTITGTLVNVDGLGNLTLSKAKLCKINDKQLKVDEILVKSSSIRYVQLPDHIDQVKTIKTYLQQEEKPRRKK